MGRYRDLTGLRFGRLRVLKPASRKGGALRWECQCDCGNTKIVRGYSLTGEHTKSCGCLNNESIGNRSRKHGLRASSLYTVWVHMKDRCLSETNSKFYRYGARGISICPEWLEAKNFLEWAMANGWEKGLQIDRIDNDGGYKPSNCRFVTPTENIRNSSATKLTFNKATYIRKLYYLGGSGLTELGELFGVTKQNIRRIVNNEIWLLK